MGQRIKVGIRIVRRRGEGEMYAQLRWTLDGVERTEAIGWTTKEGVDAAIERKQAELLLGVSQTESRPRPTVTVGYLIGEYAGDLEQRNVGGPGYRTNIENRSVPLTRHLGRIDIGRFTLRDVEAYVATRRRELVGRMVNRLPKRSTVMDELALLRRVITATRTWGEHNTEWPGMPSMKGWPEDARPPRRVSDTEHEALVAEAAKVRPELGHLFGFLGWCPRRPVAIFALRRQDVVRALDPSYRGNDLVYFEKDKGGVGRGWGPLLPEARQILQDHLEGTIGPPEELVFRTFHKRPFDSNAANLMLRRYLGPRAKVADVHPYDLRKLAAVRAYEAVGRSLKATCRFTGHKQPEVLLRRYLFDEEEAVTVAVRAKPSARGGR
jgi:integrase